MEIRDLEYFLAAAKTGNFTTAARKVHIVQSAMSAAISRLEVDLGVTLFDRSTSPLTVTNHGDTLVVAAQRVLDTVQAARDELDAVSGEVRGTAVLGSTLNTGPLDLTAVLVDIRRSHPQVSVHLRQSSAGSTGNLQALLSGDLDVALTATPRLKTPPPGIAFRPLVSEPLVFLCRIDHPLAGRNAVTVDELLPEDMVRFPPGWGIRDTTDAVFGGATSALEVANYTLAANLVASGLATALIPASAVPAHRRLAAVKVRDPRMTWNLSAAVAADRRLPSAAAVLLDALARAAGIGQAKQQTAP
jgi:DNA-binding transcriptional LysR family regulator